MDIIDESIELDDEPREESEAPKRIRPLLEVWWEVLSNSAKLRHEKISMAMSTRLRETYPWLDFKDMPEHYTRFYDAIDDAFDAVDQLIRDNPKALEVGDKGSPESDGVVNAGLYLQTIIDWNTILQAMENDFEVTADNAGVQQSAFLDAARFLVGEQGLLAHLEAIEFTYGEDEHSLVQAALSELGEQ